MQQKTTSKPKTLNEKRRQAIEMRYLGKTSKDIADATGYSEAYVRNLFMEGGRLESAYRDFAAIQQQEAQNKITGALNRAREEAQYAIDRIIILSQKAKNESASLKANQFLLDLAGASNEVSFKDFIRGMGFKTAAHKIDEMFQKVFGKSIGEEISFLRVFRAMEERERELAGQSN